MDAAKILANVQNARRAMEAKNSAGINAHTLPNGESRWRILPGWRAEEREKFFHDFGKHWIKDSSTGKILATYLCERDTFGQRCEVCEVVNEAIRASKDDKVLEALREMTSRRRILVNALFVAGNHEKLKPDLATPVLLELPPTMFDAYLRLYENRAKDDISLLSLEEGRHITFTKEGSGLNTKYALTGDAAKESRIDPSVMTRLVNIDAYIANEKARGVQAGVKPLNEQIAARLKVSRTAVPGLPAGFGSFNGGIGMPSAAAAAIAAPAAAAGVTTPNPVRLVDVRADETPAPVAGTTDPELSKLLAELDA